MLEALSLARRGNGYTRPNPPVGAVVVKNGSIVGRGWHQKAGTPHAEVHALNDAGEQASGATIYVTLEPCNHTGKTPPCTRAILDAGISRVVIGALDPNPAVTGGGMEYLRGKGVEVSEGCLRDECRLLVAPFAKHARTGVPWVRIKVACSMDGRTATRTGDSQWITNSAARKYGHELRRITDAILVGRNTVASDNPSLTCRSGAPDDSAMDPLRVVLDSGLSSSPESKIYVQDSTASTVVAAVEGKAGPERVRKFEKQGVEVLVLPDDGNGRVGLEALLEELGRRGVQSLLVEGGAEVHGSFWDSHLVDEAFFFYAPVIIGGVDSRPAVAGMGADALKNAPRLDKCSFRPLKGNWLVAGVASDLDELWGAGAGK